MSDPPPEPAHETISATAGLDATRYRDVRVFGGSLSFSSDATQKKFIYPNSMVTLTCDHRVSGALYLVQTAEDIYMWSGTLKGAAQIKCIRTQVFPATGYTIRETVSGPTRLINTNARVFLDPGAPRAEDAKYFGLIYGDDSSSYDTASIPVTRTFESPSGTRVVEDEQYVIRHWKLTGTEYWRLPESGLGLSGSEMNDPQTTVCSSADEVVPWKFSFSLSPMELNEVKLFLDPEPGYEKWLPSAPTFDPGLDTVGVPPLGGVSLAPGVAPLADEPPVVAMGDTVRFFARLVAPSGIKAKSITFRMKSSQVPGESNNAPLFRPVVNEDDLVMMSVPSTPVDITRSTLQGSYKVLYTGTTPEGSYDLAEINVGSYDWGAYGELEATATLTNGASVNAVVVFDGTNGPLLRIPKRAAGSYVADDWKAKNGGAGKADDDDSDSAPVGDGNAGDGLTVYEEYRGFLAGGKHVRTHAGKKDYFLALASELHASKDPLSDASAAGIVMFEKATELVVHQLEPGEFLPATSRNDFNTERRIINHYEAPEGRRKVKQHLVMVTKAKTPKGNSKAWFLFKDRLGTPKDVSRIEIEETSADAKNGGAGQVATDVAHELGHTVNIHHHGDKEVWTRYHIVGTDGVYVESTSPGVTSGSGVIKPDEVYVTDESKPTGMRLEYSRGGVAYGARKSERVLVSHSPPNQYGGDETCFMRYNSANVVVLSGAPTDNRLVISPREAPGTKLCTSQSGTSFNPRRHGNAAPARGDCLHQILVNDAVTPPVRLP